MFKVLVVLLFTLLATACASVPMAALEADQEAKEFKVPANKSRIYVFRDEGTFGGAIKVATSIDGKVIGQTAPKSFYVVDVDPGNHTVSCLAESNSSVTLNTKKDKAYYVWQEMKMGLMAAGCALHEVAEQEGQKRVMTCKRALLNTGL